MHVDGFRFDLAAALARPCTTSISCLASFMLIHQDPTLSQIKMIAEPWTSGREDIRSATFRFAGQSGTVATATRCAASGAATADWHRSLPIGLTGQQRYLRK